jgi:hypothetical protein
VTRAGAQARPLLLIDVDGVLNPYGADAYAGDYVEHKLFPAEDEPVRILAQHGVWLRRLSGSFDLAWASSWQEEANRLLTPLLELPSLPFVQLPPSPFPPPAKVPAVAAFVGNRAAAWMDDELTPEAYAWAVQRTAPTLLLPIVPHVGLTIDAVLALEAFALRAVSARR